MVEKTPTLEQLHLITLALDEDVADMRDSLDQHMKREMVWRRRERRLRRRDAWVALALVAFATGWTVVCG